MIKDLNVKGDYVFRVSGFGFRVSGLEPVDSVVREFGAAFVYDPRGARVDTKKTHVLLWCGGVVRRTPPTQTHVFAQLIAFAATGRCV